MTTPVDLPKLPPFWRYETAVTHHWVVRATGPNGFTAWRMTYEEAAAAAETSYRNSDTCGAITTGDMDSGEIALHLLVGADGPHERQGTVYLSQTMWNTVAEQAGWPTADSTRDTIEEAVRLLKRVVAEPIVIGQRHDLTVLALKNLTELYAAITKDDY